MLIIGDDKGFRIAGSLFICPVITRRKKLNVHKLNLRKVAKIFSVIFVEEVCKWLCYF